MACTAYRATNFRPETLERIEQAQEIISGYTQKLTARQVFYQFVSRDLLENTPKNYKLLTSTLTDARYAGLIDWDVIEDRGREPDSPSQWESIPDLADAAARSFRLPRWKTQPVYVELWVEKQALAGVLAPLARAFHVTLMVNKGYSSASAMKEAADRIREARGVASDEYQAILKEGGEELQPLIDDGQKDSLEYKRKLGEWADKLRAISRRAVIFYLGDHDPSGEDMVRDIHDRLDEFGADPEVKKLALTMAQIRKWNPPPNPAKITDSRARGYIEKFGNKSWELDALPPDELTRIVRNAFKSVIDQTALDKVLEEEKRLRARLREEIEKVSSW